MIFLTGRLEKFVVAGISRNALNFEVIWQESPGD